MPPLTHAKWSINDRCNLRCPFCCADSEFKEQTLDEQFRVIDKLNDMGIRSIDFYGKEVFYDERIFFLWERAAQYGMEISFITNGANLEKFRERILNFNRECGLVRQMAVSLDFGASRAFVPPLDILIPFMREGIHSEFSIDLMESNLRRSLNLLSVSGIADEYFIKPIVSIGSNADYAKGVVISQKSFASFIEAVNEMELPVPVYVSAHMTPYKVDKRRFGNPNLTIECGNACHCGKSTLFIASDGRAYGCGFASYSHSPYSCDFLSTPMDEVLRRIKPPRGKKGCSYAP